MRRKNRRSSPPFAPSYPPGLKPIQLSKPDLDGGKSVLASLRRRKTDRNIGSRKIQPWMLSDLLWAASGINRKKGPFGIPGRTAASASNSQEIELFVALREGFTSMNRRPIVLYRWSLGLAAHALKRPGEDGSHGTSPVDLRRGSRKIQPGGLPGTGLVGSGNAKGLLLCRYGPDGRNVYLFAASQGLSAWFHNCDKAGLHARLKLKLTQRVLFGQTIGYSSA